MANPTQATIRRLFATSGNFCAFPGCGRHIVDPDTGIILAEICHIHARNPAGPRYDPSQSEKIRNGYDNLILLCADHHKIIDASPQGFPAETLRGLKESHEQSFGRQVQDGDGAIARLLLQIYIDNLFINKVIGDLNINAAGSINVRTNIQKIIIAPPPGTIGTDQNFVRYIEHLIKRYNEFASKDPFLARRFSHGAIRKNIEHNFGAVWQKLPLEKANVVISYLQERIDKTSIAKINSGRGKPSYSTFEKFSSKHE